MTERAVTSHVGTPDAAAESRRDPFVLDVRSLSRRAGTMTETHRTVTTPAKIGGEMIAIPENSEVDLDLRLESVTEGVLVTGTVCGETAGQCARCLEPVDGTVSIFLTELFAYPDSETEQTTDADDVYRIVDDRLDLEQAIIDAVADELPMSPLCADDCPGLCQVCGIRLAIAEPGHAHDIIDPRWAKLADKFPAAEESGETSSGEEPGAGS
ncbi:DUF177 domain-containing protein [Gordonia sp. ABSL1-1]|uniref:YceD family protein n=1 Tax=Gordonia sp. ABSL1-1 TaxID=3053923 RepID=UPI0025733F03|nr:DUF177 domain-containing protein [Gordonia sp. ABSL1-1]MDL9939012.1 DUF177 domain-containing protein [Gordonia sp. ABSL1-1]